VGWYQIHPANQTGFHWAEHPLVHHLCAGLNGSAVNGGAALAGLEPVHERPSAISADGHRSNGELHSLEKTQGDKDK
jgi:hypothetical protein